MVGGWPSQAALDVGGGSRLQGPACRRHLFGGAVEQEIRQSVYDDLATEIALHRKSGDSCRYCHESWPCDARYWLETARRRLAQQIAGLPATA